MNPEFRSNHNRPAIQRGERGQTIIVALIILGLLLIIGFVFIGIISRSLNFTSTLYHRGRANDFSEAGIRFAHQQLLRSEQGADWRPLPTPMLDEGATDFTRDPDAFFLRPPANVGNAGVRFPGSVYFDQGGPDGLGPFFRTQFRDGRALIRIRWAPSDANIFRNSPSGPLRTPGAARNYIFIEAVGRDGTLSVSDPTALTNQVSRKYRNYATTAEFQQALNQFRSDQSRYGGIQVNRAFASIGIIETARFIANKYNVATPADLGVDDKLGAMVRDAAVTDLPTQLGTAIPLLTFEGPAAATPTTQSIPLGGSFFSNASVRLHGHIIANLNYTLGDQFLVAGDITGDSNAALTLVGWKYNPAVNNYQPLPGFTGPGGSLTLLSSGGQSFSSKSPNFFSAGLLRDNSQDRSVEGVPRGVGTKAPPSILALDPQTHTDRYVQMTRESGVFAGTTNSGHFGYGAGVYVDNFSDRQMGQTETGRQNLGGSGSLINDWLNPSNRDGGSWRGFYYTPPGAYLQLLTDGFMILRDGRAPQSERTWKTAAGADTGQAAIRFRLGRGSDRRLRIVNTFQVANINGNLAPTDYDNGQPFNGVLFFEGNVRVRGNIPTDLQLTVVSNATIYIEGSITKGVTGNDWTASYGAQDPFSATPQGTRLTRPTRSMLMLMAKDYVALNTTQFFAPTPGQDVQPKEDIPNVPSMNPVLIRTNNTLTTGFEFVLDPNGPNVTTPSNPSQWRPFASDYFELGQPSNKIATNILLTHTMEDGPAQSTFIAWDVNLGFGTPTYQFPTINYSNSAAPYFTTANIPLYGLGMENYQRFGKFESIALPLVDPTTATTNANTIVANNLYGKYTLFTQSRNDLNIRTTSVGGVSTNDYVLGRLALAPHDIRIEAAIYAEEGSFFVIPGPWFNPNPNDTFDRWSRNDDASGNVLSTDERNARRTLEYGSAPMTPFYGEPLDNRIVISGAISENMPPTAAQQAEWMRKWGWIPRYMGATNQSIPAQHIPAGTAAGATYVPNIIVTYDPVLATGRRFGFVEDLNNPGTYVRTQWVDYNHDGVQQSTELLPLPPLPRLPVSPTLAFFGEVH
ncbi:hypothetical protein [Fimbriimonas ginsengisoli]|uniref:Uncharacterized protein n=1 Tax=Fimbriimonas ginsengisoli Gsoil 348 TaxID=661478 RepID=A0A068NQW5_FIMGI|nr:hypothetical protein [Fimbriimonas ginsengisoli]AIE85772.1 hypothetical protein OP10G_2404 [Fimbriimonas ginsengisoli Gsoil 348]